MSSFSIDISLHKRRTINVHTRLRIFISSFIANFSSRAHEISRARESSQKELKNFISAEIRGMLIESGAGKAIEKSVYPIVKAIPDSEKLRILVTGGSGFVGSHLVDRLMLAGHQVTVIDNMFTGRKKNIAHWIGHPNFLLIIHDVVEPIMMEVIDCLPATSMNDIFMSVEALMFMQCLRL